MRHLALAYGIASYALFLGVFLYAIGFVGDVLVPRSIDSPVTGIGWQRGAIQDVALLLLFAVPHSLMARPVFKAVWTKIVPPPIERSTYVLASSILLAALCWWWIPIPSIVWELGSPALRILVWGLFCAGWALVLLSTFVIDHFDLFGLRQVYSYYTGRTCESVPFSTPLLYRWVRHPLVLGFLVAFWAAPMMTAGRLLFAAATTVYCLVAIRLEERDLLGIYGAEYAAYQRQVPMLVPLPCGKRQG